MSLQQRLERIREGFVKQAPPETLAIMNRAAEEIRNSGVLDNVVGEGLSAPGFTLSDSRDTPVTLQALRSRGPVVLTFFRGDW